jgi:hypothetical protein
MSVIGWFDDTGKALTFAQIRAGEGQFSAPLPVLLSMMSNVTDPHDYADLTASFIAGALWRQKLLERRHDIYVDWYSSYFAWLGTAVHAEAERAAAAIAHYEVLTERRMATRHKSGLWVGAISDLLQRPAPDKPWELWDYKSTGAYAGVLLKENGVRAEHPEWVRQFGLGRYLAGKSTYSTRPLGCGEPENEPLDVGPVRVCCLFRDWKPADAEKVKPVEVFDVPGMSDSEVEEMVDSAVADYLTLKDTPDNLLPPCPPDQLWLNENPKARQNYGKIQRFQNYCAGREFCNQYKIATSKRGEDGRFTMDILKNAAAAIEADIAAANTKED